MSTRPLDRINEIIIHCAATPNGKWFTAFDIDQWHAKRGFKRDPRQAQYSPHKHIGYHFVIGIKGGVEIGRNQYEIGAHCQGRNLSSIGICLVGTDKFTIRQWDALKALVLALLMKFPNAHVLGHRDTSPDANGDGHIDRSEWTKTCPGFDVYTWLRGEMQPLPPHLLDMP
ncbi:N-acetylmuramoyl-L-alanine amidase [Methylomicrobium sp. Wu6]|uniref:N-acetylmuramoyl-L-alanine amidase n=1 Tax=Methylomicrobium sp. Wu6 TaxID=3107928 RepID=UPI002DD62FFC|nr:N-acetylmuramoyl-L-alanine amidase [Methylomicrobium sp. Wu6]MEC4750014.1 N-acetylmuramoyl-L-alanine amidase [Methylomicrobium sp. Wu6]